MQQATIPREILFEIYFKAATLKVQSPNNEPPGWPTRLAQPDSFYSVHHSGSQAREEKPPTGRRKTPLVGKGSELVWDSKGNR
jgi:hypothetical protein